MWRKDKTDALRYRYKFLDGNIKFMTLRLPWVVIDLIAKNANLTVVGDDNQSIYGFKNAHPEGIIEFPNSHKNCKDFTMKECRRCPRRVVQIANNLISQDPKYNRQSKQVLEPFDKNEEGIIDVVQWRSVKSEIEGLAKSLKALLQKHMDEILPQDVLVLNPSRKIAQLIADELTKIDVPSKMVSKNIDLLLNTENSRSLYAFITLLANPNDYVSFRYLLQNKGNFYSKQYVKIMRVAEKNNLNPIEVFDKIVDGTIKINRITENTAIIKKYNDLITMINEWNSISDVTEIEKNFINNLSGENENLFLEKLLELCNNFNIDDSNPNNLINQLANHIKSNLFEVVITEEDVFDDEKVKVMTCHSAKGLSGKLVIISSCVDGLMPRNKEDQDIDEQRRLLYVAMTRCKYTIGGYQGRLVISSFTQMQEGQKKNLGIEVPYRGVRASRFLMHIDTTLLPKTKDGEEFLSEIIDM